MAEAAAQIQGFSRPQTGRFDYALYQRVLENVHELGAVLTLTVSNGREERVFFFTRGAILFLATGQEVVARKLIEKKLLAKELVDALVKRANSGTPLLQDLIETEGHLPQEKIRGVVEEVIEEHLLEIAYWDGALYDLVPGNPPPRLYDPDVPAVRMSLGVKNLIGRVRPKAQHAADTIQVLGGSLRHKVRTMPRTTQTLPPQNPSEVAVRGLLSDTPKPILDVVAEARKQNIAPVATLDALCELVRTKRVTVVKVAERTREEELAIALSIEKEFQEFINRLLTRTHLAAIYERIHENDKAADQYRGIADEHLAQDRVQEGLASLKDVLRLRPLDVGARELTVKVLQGLGKLGEAAREGVDLARALIQMGLPGRARAAYELALKLVPKSSGVLWMLATLLGRLGEKEEAVKRYQEIAQIAASNGDEQGALAAYQQLLEVDPANAAALGEVRKISGYGRALASRWASAAAGVLILLVVVGYGAFEMRALAAYRSTRDQAWAAVKDDKFDVARSITKDFVDHWDLSRFRKAGVALLERIDQEERAVADVRAWRAARSARALESEGNIPAALENWTVATKTDDARKREDAQQGVARCEALVSKARTLMEEADKSLKRDSPRDAYDLLARALRDAPWLKTWPELKVPWRIESVPPGARVVLDGVALDKPTPVVAMHSASPGNLVLEGPRRDPLQRRIEEVPPWPLKLVLPRHPSWTADGTRGATGPVLAGDVIVTGGRDRSVTAVERANGKVRWKNVDALGVFGECHVPPAALPAAGVVVARADAGTVAGIDLETGATLWRADLAPAPFDPIALWASRPVAVAATNGVVVRDGARGLVCLDARSGQPRWRASARSDVIGAPEVAGDLVAVVSERTLACHAAKSGDGSWVARLPKAAVTGAAADHAANLYVGLDSGQVAAIDKVGNFLGAEKVGEAGSISTPVDASAERVVVGLANGEVVALAPGAKSILFRTTLEDERSISWVRSIDKDLVLVGDGVTIRGVFGQGGELWRHPAHLGARPRVEGVVEPDPPATADATSVYAPTDEGLVALER